ncbi:MAG: transcriptional regulator BetI [Hyphomicrobiales bacterium]
MSGVRKNTQTVVRARQRPEGQRFSRESPDVRRRSLIEASIRCIAAGGIQAFTVDRICKEAGVSRGLINHYFREKDDLLVEVYRTSLYEPVMALLEAEDDGPAVATLKRILDSNFTPTVFDKANLLVWLSLWGEAATNPALNAAHRELYRRFRQVLADAIAAVAAERDRRVEAVELARNVIALIDGLWLEWSLDDTAVDPASARAACYDLVEGKLGPL